MKLATITNWAYGATLILTLMSGGTMLFAANAQDNERAAVAQRYQLDALTAQLDEDMYAQTGLARQYVITGAPNTLIVYDQQAKALQSLDDRTRRVRDAGASFSELAALKDAMRWSDTLHDEQMAAIEAWKQGDRDRARTLLFGPEYERELDRVKNQFEQFQTQLDQRTSAEVDAATRIAKVWRTVSELTLAITALLFLCVLYFVFKRRVLRPVIRLSDVIARLAVQDYAAVPPSLGQVDEIGDMAQAIGIFRENGLERQRLERERDLEFSMRDLIARMTQRMQGCDSRKDLEDVIQRFVPEIAPALAGRLYLMDEKRGAMVEACSWQSPVHSRSEFSPLGCWALRRGVPHRPSGQQIDIPCEHVQSQDGIPVDSICLPLTAQRETLGLLYLEPLTESALDGIPETYLVMLAENIGLAFSNLKLRETLREMAMVDPLTGLANRRSLENRLAAAVAEAERLDKPLSCLMVDVDHFKRFNDEHGHDAGDAVLRAVGESLLGITREHGMAFRYGGEEFALLMPGLTSAQAQERAETIRRRIAALAVRHDNKNLDAISVSLGLATTPEHGPPNRLIKLADEALIRAKATGRNRVVVSDGKDRRESAA
ncbi:diguanylate cyclase [Asticcacaulis sp. EMRT-3]|uniref:diguanylate cyclase n=1 Tax=Asticcacaulis sp. EMRT-3 TaxID=3040349 RepID=UPI0024AF9B0D|nr:diguanylate cyclase [Asticcacaulis sp. EMRT-3]MDI7775103.1 diguanylate cyclase [Asticcacaulis sp. EMRT-3]